MWFYYRIGWELINFSTPKDSIKLWSYYQIGLRIQDKKHSLSSLFFQCYFMKDSSEWCYGIILDPYGFYIQYTDIDINSGLCIILNDCISNYLLFSSTMSLIVFYFTPMRTYSSRSWFIYIWIWMNIEMFDNFIKMMHIN